MANPVKGEVPLEIGGKVYTFVLGTYGLAALERRMKMPWPKIFKRASDGEFGIDDVLAVVHAGLLKHHRGLTEENVADLIDAAGMESINAAIGEALKLIAPATTTGGEESENPPPKAANGSAVGMTS